LPAGAYSVSEAREPLASCDSFFSYRQSRQFRAMARVKSYFEEFFEF
jgi:hypothetical protein